MPSRLFLLSILFLFASAAVFTQDRCLRITRLPAPEKPTEWNIKGDQIWSRLLVEFKSNGSVGTVQPLVFGIDRKLDALVRDAARRIEFIPKRIGDQTVTVRRDVYYGYTLSKAEWTMTPAVGDCLTQTKSLDDTSENRLRATARDLVAAWADSHDLRVLETRFFLPGYTAVIGSPDMAPLGGDIFGQLTDSERRSAFMSLWNYAYLRLLIARSAPRTLECWDESSDCEANRRQSMLRVLSTETIDAILAQEQDDREPTTKAELLAAVHFVGDVFERALPTLQRQDLEQTIEFRDRTSSLQNNYGLDYFIGSGLADRDYRDMNGRIVIAKGENLYAVETPLMIRIDLVQRGSTFKVFNIGPGGGE